MVVLLLFALLSGLVTILAPCIWPLLPIILSSSVAGKGHRRPLGITLGIMISFGVFTLSLSYLVRAFHFNPDILRLFAVIVIGLLGVAMIIPSFNRLLELAISRLSGKLGSAQKTKGNGFGAGLITGLSLGTVWSPCAGPILASIAALSATGRVSGSVILVTIFYVIGVGIPLFLFASAGRSLLTKTKKISPYTGRIQQVFGVIMILTALAIFTNYDKTVQASLLNVFPEYTNALTSLENNQTVKDQLNSLKGTSQNLQIASDDSLFNVNPPVNAPEIVGITKWLNTSSPLTLSQLRGKVVLIDFWTYTCINCIRTLPFVTSWYDKYEKYGFVVIGVHTPEFEFEKNTNNVQSAIQRFGIHYPVAQDNDYATWTAFNNEYWPAEYLIDAKGQIRRVEFGEGHYDESEKAIRELLSENGKKVTEQMTNATDQTPITRTTPETYLGAKRAEYYAVSGNVEAGTKKFQTEENIPLDTYSLGGTWTIQDENMVSGDKAEIVEHFGAEKVYLVIGPGQNKTATVKVYLDGKPIAADISGDDVKNSIVTVDSQRLYSLVNLHGNPGEHTLKLQFLTPKTEPFVFTFG